MSLLGRESTIDIALKDVRRGLADAEAFMEICRFEFKHPRPAPGSTMLGRRWDRPDFLDDFTAQPLSESTIEQRRRPPTDDTSDSQGVVATSVRDTAPTTRKRETAPPAREPETTVPPARKRATAAKPPAVEAADTADQPVEELPPVVDPPQDDDTDWPEMPDFLDRRN